MKYSRLLVLILLVVFFAAATKTFWGPDNWGNVSNIVLQQAPFTILLAICMTLVIVLKGFDLSIGSAVALRVWCLIKPIIPGLRSWPP